MPKISIIVPVYNVEQYLDKCISSLISQTYKDFEIILIDDGSTDNSGLICERFANNYDNITAYHIENKGISNARNFGVSVSEGKFITFVDSDDYVKSTYLEYLLNLFKYSEVCKVTACNHTVIRNGKNNNNSDYDGILVLNTHDALKEALYHKKIDVSVWGKLFKKEIFSSITFPVGKIYEDTYVFGDILKSAPEIVYGGDSQYYYIQRNASIVNSEFHSKRIEFIEAVEHMLDGFDELYPDLKDGFTRRRVHARLSVLRYMEKADRSFNPLKSELKNYILKHSKEVTSNPLTPKRDKMAIFLLRFGYFVFYKVWNLYSKVR